MDSALLFLSRLTGRSHSLHIADARESLAYWSRRSDELPWHRRAARREARERVSAARARLIGAHLEHTPVGLVAPRLVPLLDVRVRGIRAFAFTALRRTAIGRKVLIGAAASGVAALAILAATTILAAQVLL